MNIRIIKYLRASGIFLALLAMGIDLHAQQISAGDLAILKKKEDSLQALSARMVFDSIPANRFRSDSQFVRTFVRALVTPNSFYYPFDSLNISRLYAPDSSFRIFTWQMKKDEYVYLQKGAIQVPTKDGRLKLYPLFDASMFTKNPMDSVRTARNWIGAIYYRIILKESNGKKYYTLLGFDDYSINSNKKWMEVLTFNAQGEPVFGGPFFSYQNDSIKKPVQKRFSIEYKKEAKTFLNYDPELDVILVDHLISESDETERKSTYVPDGDYEAFKWQNGQWVHINKLFNQSLKDGDFPKEALLLDDAGKANERQLEEASRKNIEKSNKKPAPATPKKKDN
ncbi:hypothetical protein [Paraflavitalea sp. CAU 1676]|uniref:hypothetical protein n=1 Tax=Paraflavitalea sp. CAU 1676 TaxID=3032598 RepID=UPI0023DB6737|nr:hypothetical protein [Paraflavitalea sp. CAU 1676]MDF2189195.1 hypothetical protein [Paraflavitalea sp. CAU 1676]